MSAFTKNVRVTLGLNTNNYIFSPEILGRSMQGDHGYQMTQSYWESQKNGVVV